MERDLNELKNYSLDFTEFLNDFDFEMDYLANKASLDGQVQELMFIETELKKGSQFFKSSDFKFSTFSYLALELENIDQLGKITDNSDFSMPLVAFNTYQLQVFNYHEKLRDFKELKFYDEDQLSKHDVPRFFKTMYIPDDRFLLIGGQERDNPSLSSKKVFLLDDKGKLQQTSQLNKARQYFATCPDYENEFAYVIGGYNHKRGLLNLVEKFSFKARKWIKIEAINHARINASSTKCGNKFLYLFGGLDKRDFLDSIERFNLTLDIWTVMKIKMPQRMANFFSFSLNKDYILIMGGMKKKQEDFIPKESKKIYEIESRVFALKTSNSKWKDLKPFPFKKKFGNIVYNGFGKFFCFVIENNKELPQLFVYDVRNCFPQFDKYWENEKNQREGLQKIKGKDIKVHSGYSFMSPNEKNMLNEYSEGPVNIAESHNSPSALEKQIYSYTGEPIPSSSLNLIPAGKSIELGVFNN
ncbi:kelch motif family protein [Stylonychia lemnae]|uniref:Kelch motif family protein n=1 Tax=Stylonychia lemnae TaxID=5949 RepID=A0A078AZZ2_STYLE|nr:kelch motif family protein [Stylonychia lemnae]|eukprot:CDW86358.1 kelch motif family protein [Stylonychia lemnae]